MADDTEQRPVALITGAGSGIGRQIAIHLAGTGWDLALVGRREQPLAETGGLLDGDARWAAISADIGDVDGAQQMIDACVAQLGRLDALVNNAGLAPAAAFAEHTPELIDQVFQVNALGPIRAMVAAIAAFDGPGVIVNVSSVAAADPFPGLGVYGSAKASVETAARAVANELGTRGVRAYAVAPGAVETAMLRSIVDDETLPTEATLDPADVAAAVVACVTGDTDAPNGSTISMPSPAG